MSQDRALAFDHGGRRIGVAYADRIARIASPLGVVPATDGIPIWHEIDRLIRDWQPAELVVGVPYNSRPLAATGQPSSEAAAEQFATALEKRSGLPVIRIDETLTSHEAEDRLREQRRSGVRGKRTRSGDVDAIAACVIAEAWLGQR